MKVVIAARLSRQNDGSTGLDSQENETIRWAEQHGHEVVAVVADHKTGTSDLWGRPNLRAWVTEPEKLASYDALVALKVDRLTRADDEGISRMKSWARDHSKSLMFVQAGVQFPSEGVEGLLFDAHIRMAHQEWLSISERYRRMQRTLHERDSHVGRVTWGYDVVKAEGIKVLVPNDLGQKWIPAIMQWVTEGHSLTWICEELTNLGVRGPNGTVWHQSSVGRMVRCQTYSGHRRRSGHADLQVTALVPADVQAKAIAVLDARVPFGRSGKLDKPLLQGLRCGHPDCPGQGSWAMYRVAKHYYRCSGSSANFRKGCGAPMVRTEVAERLVLGGTSYWNQQPHEEDVYVPGNTVDEELNAARAQMALELSQTAPDDIPVVATAWATKLSQIASQGHIEPSWIRRSTGQTEGEYLVGLDDDQLRGYLARQQILAWRIGPVTSVLVNGMLGSHGGPTAISKY